jgi:hypothetical protein
LCGRFFVFFFLSAVFSRVEKLSLVLADKQAIEKRLRRNKPTTAEARAVE